MLLTNLIMESFNLQSTLNLRMTKAMWLKKQSLGKVVVSLSLTQNCSTYGSIIPGTCMLYRG